jgi:hypothetical protein
MIKDLRLKIENLKHSRPATKDFTNLESLILNLEFSGLKG